MKRWMVIVLLSIGVVFSCTVIPCSGMADDENSESSSEGSSDEGSLDGPSLGTSDCQGGGGLGGGCGEGESGPSAAEKAADTETAGHLLDAREYNLEAASLYGSLSERYSHLDLAESSLNRYSRQVGDAYADISGYHDDINQVCSVVQSNLSAAYSFTNLQLGIAEGNREQCLAVNNKTQGAKRNDPVYIASGVEEYIVVDFQYTQLRDEIKIQRSYRSNRNTQDSSFGLGWVFNYDTKIIVGRKPFIRERESLTADLSMQTTGLDAQATEKLNNAQASLALASTYAAQARAQSDAIAALKEEIQALTQAIVEKKNAAQASADAAAQSAPAGTAEAATSASLAQQEADAAQTLALSAASQAESSAARATAAAQQATAVENAASEAAELVNLITEKKAEADHLAALLAKEAAEAAAEARLEEQLFPQDPYPTDETVYFGPGYIQVIESGGSPVLYELQEDGQYIPIADSGSYTSTAYQTDAGFSLVSKKGAVNEYAKTGTGTLVLSATKDSNGNVIVFSRDDESLTITDAVGRKTVAQYDAAGHITGVVDPQENTYTYTYENNRLKSYTDPLGYVWSYGYDENNRLIARTDPQGNSYHYTYDEQGRVEEEIDKAGFAIRYTYNPENRTTIETDRRGNTRYFYYNDANRIERIAHPDGSSVSYTYDDRNNVASTTDENGVTTYFRYNAINDVISVTDGLGGITSLTYDPKFNTITSTTDPLGRTRIFAYDNHGNLINVTHPDGTSRSFTYNTVGLPIGVTDENGNISTLSYDRYGQPASVTHPDGTKETITADILGRITAVTDENGNTSRFAYNQLGKVTQTIDPLGAETLTEYDSLGKIIKQTDAKGNAYSYQYSVRGNLTQTTDPLGHSELFAYDAAEKLVRKTFPNNTGVAYTLDSRERIISETTFPGNRETQYTHDGKGQKTAVTDANGNTSSFQYDALGRLISSTDAEGYTLYSSYDSAGNLIELTDANGNPMSYGYDSRDRRILESNALGNATTFSYDGVGNVIAKQKPDGSVITNSYDARNRLVLVSYPDGTTKEYGYDKVGNMTYFGNAETAEVREYDPLGRLLATSDSYNGQIDYRYDILGNRTEMMDPENGVMRYAYDAANRVSGFTDPEGGRTSYEYDAMGRVIRTIHANNTETLQEYDDDNRLLSISTYGDREGGVSSFDYTYDAVGNKLSMTEKDGHKTSYQYDNLYRLVTVDYPPREWEPELAADEKNNGTLKGKGQKKGHFKNRCDETTDCLPSAVRYAYDPAGNRISQSDDWQTVAYRYDAANRMLQAGTVQFTYDVNGNRIQKSDSGEIARYSYSYDDLISQTDSPDGESTGYGYDALNRRIYKVNQDGDTTSYLYDGTEVLQEISGRLNQKIATYYRANGRILTRQEFVASQGHNVAYRNRPTGRQLYYSYDGLGSVAGLTNHHGKLVTSYQYDVFGTLTGGDITENPYTFTGKRFDEESGLYHFHFRQCDPGTGVWTTPDPIGILGGVNVYSYVVNNPVNVIDPWGLDAYTVGGTINIPIVGGVEAGLVIFSGNGVRNFDLGIFGTYHRPVGGFALAKGTWGVSQSIGGRKNFDGEDIETAISVLDVGVTASGFNNSQIPSSMGFDVGPQFGYETNATLTGSITIGDLARGAARLIYGDGGSIFDNSIGDCGER